IFNLLGPLTNPAGASRQLIGVARAEHVPLVAEALRRLGAERAIVMHGTDDGGGPGLDEFTLTAPTGYAELAGGAATHRSVAPAALGLASAVFADLAVESVEASAELVRGILTGAERGAKTEMVLLSAGAAGVVAGAAGSLAEGLSLAREAIESG